MKKFLVVLVALGLAIGAHAQKGRYYRGGHYRVRPRVMIGIGGAYGPSPFYRPYYSPFYSPYGYGYPARPSRLGLEIQDIKLDYADRIKSVRKDKSIPRRERKERIRNLKYDRDKAIIDAQRDYYYKRRDGR